MFKKYNSIENTYREKAIEQVYLHGYAQQEFVVQEKVHGANASFVTNGVTIRVAKRSGLLEEGERFNNYEYVLDRYAKAILDIFNLVKARDPETETITVFGELFGGNYDH